MLVVVAWRVAAWTLLRHYAMWCKSSLQLAGKLNRDTVVESVLVFTSSELMTSVVYKSIE